MLYKLFKSNIYNTKEDLKILIESLQERYYRIMDVQLPPDNKAAYFNLFTNKIYNLH